MSFHIPRTSTKFSGLALRTSVCDYLYFPFEDAKSRRAILHDTLKMKHQQEQTHLLLTHSTHQISKSYDSWTMRFGPSLRCLQAQSQKWSRRNVQRPLAAAQRNVQWLFDLILAPRVLPSFVLASSLAALECTSSSEKPSEEYLASSARKKLKKLKKKDSSSKWYQMYGQAYYKYHIKIM